MGDTANEMTVDNYQAAVRAAALAARMLHQYDIPAMVKAIENADAFGPLLDPTLWRNKHKAMGEDRELLEAALPLWRWGARVLKEQEEQEAQAAKYAVEDGE